MKPSTQPLAQGYLFDLQGNATGTPYVIDPPVTQVILQRVRGTLEKTVQACAFAHEQAVARFMEQHAFSRLQTEARAGVPAALEKYTRLTESCLCPLAERLQRPVCAHVQDLQPDPFGPSVRELISLLILRRKPWQKWHKQMTARINSADGEAAMERHSLRGMDEAWRAKLQAPIVAELERTRLVLLGCVNTVLTEILNIGARKKPGDSR